MRIAIMGTYRCGSTATAKSIAQLGVHLGAPFFGDYFESDSLSGLLRQWWNEPQFRETVARDERVSQLQQWIEDYERPLARIKTDSIAADSNEEKEKQSHDGGEIVCGTKHPLLSFSACGVGATRRGGRGDGPLDVLRFALRRQGRILLSPCYQNG